MGTIDYKNRYWRFYSKKGVISKTMGNFHFANFQFSAFASISLFNLYLKLYQLMCNNHWEHFNLHETSWFHFGSYKRETLRSRRKLWIFYQLRSHALTWKVSGVCGGWTKFSRERGISRKLRIVSKQVFVLWLSIVHIFDLLFFTNTKIIFSFIFYIIRPITNR